MEDNSKRIFHPALTKMALQIFDDAVEENGDDQEAALLASVAFVAAMERLRATHEEPEHTSAPAT